MSEKPSAEELVALGEQIAEQAVHLDAAMHRLLADLRRFDEAGGWLAQGFSSCAHWLSHRVGWGLATSREHLRVARALAALPEVDAALASGKLSYSKVRAITRVATPANEPTLLQYAEVSTASQMETICRKLHAAERLATDPRQALPRDDDRYVIASPTASGLMCVKAFLLPDEAALLLQAIQQAALDCQSPREQEDRKAADVSAGDSFDLPGVDAVIEGSTEPSGVPAGDLPDADAVPESSADPSCVSAGAIAAPSARSDPRAIPSAHFTPHGASRSYDRRLNRADGLMALVHTYVRGGSPHRSPIEMIITTPAETLRVAASSADAPAGRSAHVDISVHAATSGPTATPTDPHDRGASIPVAIVTETSTYLSPDAARRLACDCGVVEATVDPRGQPLSVGRKTRTIPSAIKRALLMRDRTCRFPGCDHRLFLDGHHLQHWADGGETSLRNIALLCTAHHARVHEHGYRILPSSTGELTFLDPRGHPVVAVPPRPAPAELGWPAIRAANAASCPLPLSAETSIDVGRQGPLNHKEAVGRLLKLSQRGPSQIDQGPIQTEIHRHARSTVASPSSQAWRNLAPPTASPSGGSRRRDDDVDDLDHDFVSAGHRADDLLEWSMDELRATGLDPMATVPAPIWPPPSWYESKQRPVPAPAWSSLPPRRGRSLPERSPRLRSTD